MFLKKLFSNASAPPAAAAQPVYPLEVESKLTTVHSRAPVQRHLEILYGDLTVGSERFTDLYFRCLEQTGTAVTPFNVLQRFQTRRDLVRYFLATLDVPGARAECGAYRGATALLLAHVWRSQRSDFTGENLFLIDSFSGTRDSGPFDLIAVRDSVGKSRMERFFTAGKTDVKLDDVRACFRAFPDACIIDGWIPEVFAALPETRWAFVHLDVTLFEPTLAALEYFHARMSEGGVILCDGSIFCPGVDEAIERFSARTNAPYVTLGHRQYVVMKTGPAVQNAPLLS